jgi:hypothetical protein
MSALATNFTEFVSPLSDTSPPSTRALPSESRIWKSWVRPSRFS